MPWLLGIGARLTPFLYGWFSNDLSGWVTNLNPLKDDDKHALEGWGIASLVGSLAIGYGAYQLYKKFVK